VVRADAGGLRQIPDLSGARPATANRGWHLRAVDPVHCGHHLSSARVASSPLSAPRPRWRHAGSC